MALFNAKVEYALRAVLDLATQPPGMAVQSREIAQRQGIPEAYLDQVLSLLRRQGLVRSIRGAGGGYVLGHPPHEITIARIVHAHPTLSESLGEAARQAYFGKAIHI